MIQINKYHNFIIKREYLYYLKYLKNKIMVSNVT